MKKASLILALMAGLMLPLTAVADPDSTSQSTKSDQKKSSDKAKKNDKKAKKDDKASKKSKPTTANKDKIVIRMSAEQIMLNNKAVEAVANNDFKKAELLFNALISLGENNAIWYQLGKLYAREGKCIESYDAYSRVASAPVLDNEEFTPERILEATRDGLQELNIQCSALIVFDCNKPGDEIIKLSIDGGVEFDCSSTPIPVVPGNHSVYAKTSSKFETIPFNATANQVNKVSITFSP